LVRRPRQHSIRRLLLDRRLILILALAVLAGVLAYQAPASTRIPVGWLGDRLFLSASEGQAAADATSFYGDEITAGALSGRSRWTRREAVVRLPGMGAGELQLSIRASGWPADAMAPERQPTVDVLADGVPVGQFRPTSGWAVATWTIPASARSGDDLTVTLRSSATFTSTQQYRDPRPKGVRVEEITVRSDAPGAFRRPALAPLGLLMANGALWLLALVALGRRPTTAFVGTTLILTAGALSLTFARAWGAALLPWAAVLGGLTLLAALRHTLAALVRQLVRSYGRGQALHFGLVAGAACWLALVLAQAAARITLSPGTLGGESFPDAILFGLLGMALLLLVLVLGRRGLPRLANALVAAIAAPAGGLALLAIVLVVWGGYLASVIAQLPYVGHADYADNAVVARNLVQGRGWVVDYVTQFYQLYPAITRPQETWPLLQPLWIAPFFALFGPASWAAKLPNLLFLAALGALVYRAGMRLWDRRVGIVAVIFLVTNHLFFKLVIYTTSDLAFVVFCFAALYLVYQWAIDMARPRPHYSKLVLAGILTGLMIVQKPGSGALVAAGMGLWLLARVLRHPAGWHKGASGLRALARRLTPALAWGLVAIAIVLPLVARNLATFGKLYYSTEGHDAWVLEYTKWDHIYEVYTTEGQLSALGVPDRSWVLRWGFDRALRKIERQGLAARDYLAPAWPGLPAALAPLSGRADKDVRLLFDMGAWLALLGGLAAIGRRPRLITLLLAAFVPYALFLILYWHANEERYFVVLMPWLALLAAYALWRGYDRIAALGDGRWAPLGLALALAAAALVVAPSWPKIDEKVRLEPQLYSADLDVYGWLGSHTPRDAVMMTRNPWQLNWHSQRPALMIPYTTDRVQFLRLARYYGARYLVLDSLQRPEPEVQSMLEAMLADPQLGFDEVYRTPVYVAQYNGARWELQDVVYRIPDDYGGVAPIR
jgi:hypothetical protein